MMWMQGQPGPQDYLAQRSVIKVTLYQISKQPSSRIQPQIKNCRAYFQRVRDRTEQVYEVVFESLKKDGDEVAFPVHSKMEMVLFDLKKEDQILTCFEWVMDATQCRIGCFMPIDQASKFLDCFTYCTQKIMTDRPSQQSWKRLDYVPDYPKQQPNQQTQQPVSAHAQKQLDKPPPSTKQQPTHSETIEYPDLDTSVQFQFKYKPQNYNQQQINDPINSVLEQIIKNPSCKFVHLASLYEILTENQFRPQQERLLLCKQIIFVIVETSKFLYEIQLISTNGNIELRKSLDNLLMFTVSVKESCVKWINMTDQIIQVNFNGRDDVAMSADFAMRECLYEFNHKKKLKDAIQADQLSYIKKMHQKGKQKSKQEIKNVHKSNHTQTQVSWVSSNVQASFRAFAQAKINNIQLTGSCSVLQVLRLNPQKTKIEQINHLDIPLIPKQSSLSKIFFYEREDKALLMSNLGILHTYDIAENRIISENICHSADLIDICPGTKGNNEHRTFKGVKSKVLYEIDPRCPNSIVQELKYASDPQFCTVSADSAGRYACGSLNGELRLYQSTLNKKAKCKYPGLGDPIIHTECSCDGSLLLATCPTYLILLPTQIGNENLYEIMLKINKRPTPIKLSIKLQHLQLCQKDNDKLELIPAKFSQFAAKEHKQTHIVSGFGEYVIIWNLYQILQKGERQNYRFVKMTEEKEKIYEVDFCYDNADKVILSMNSGVYFKRSKPQ